MKLPGKKHRADATDADPHWRSLYRIGGAAALAAAVLGITEVIIEAAGSSLISAPSTIAEWFTLLQSNRILGLAVLGIFESVFFILSALAILSLYPALKQHSQAVTATAVALIWTGTIIYIATNPALSLDSLSSQYALATSDAQRAILLSAGQAILALGQGTGANLTFLLSAIAGLMVSVVMLKSKVFGKPVAIVGIVANLFGLPGSALGLVVWTLNGLLMLIWIVLVGIRLLQLASIQSRADASTSGYHQPTLQSTGGEKQ